jgi:ribosomal protein L16 Arg81 hydroxylase
MMDSAHFEQDEDGEYHRAETEFWTDALKAARRRELGRGKLDKLTRSMDPLALHQLVRRVRKRLEAADNDDQRSDALRKLWRTTHAGSENFPKRFLEIAKRHRPSTAAIEIVAASYNYQPDSVRTVLKRNGFSLESDEAPQDYLSRHRI